MSSFILESSRIAQLAEYIATLNNCGFDFFGYSIPDDLHQELLDCCGRHGWMEAAPVFKRLFDLNAAAVAGRYNRGQETTPDMPQNFKPLHHPRQRGKDETIDRWYDEIQPWHYELLKTLKCFLYQCAEDATINDPLYKALRQLEYALAMHIIDNSPDYIKARWGF